MSYITHPEIDLDEEICKFKPFFFMINLLTSEKAMFCHILLTVLFSEKTLGDLQEKLDS